MKQDENTKGRKKAFCKIHEGFLLGIGGFLPQVLAVLAGAWCGMRLGIQEATKPMNAMNDKMNTITQSVDSINKVITKVDTTQIINGSDTIEIISTPFSKISMNFEAAKKNELDGFRALADKDLDLATFYFGESEKSANGYHASYEIARYLRNNRKSVSNPDFWGNTYKYVIKDFRGYIPTDVLEEMEEFIKSQN